MYISVCVCSRQSSEFSQGGSGFIKNSGDDYEQELRDYGHSQRERRERYSPNRRGNDDYDSRRSSREVSLDRYEKEVYTRGSSPSSEHNSYRSSDRFVRTVTEEKYRNKYDKDDKINDKLSDLGDVRGRRSPVYVSGRNSPDVEDDDVGSGTPPTPTEAEEPFSRTFYPRNIDSDYKPSYTVLDSKPKLKSVWVSNNNTSTPKLGSEVILPEKSSVRKRTLDEKKEKKNNNSDLFDSVGSLMLKLKPADKERQRRKQQRRFGKSSLGKESKTTRVVKVSKEVMRLPSPGGSSGSRAESENGSITEAELQNLQMQKEKLLVELGKEGKHPRLMFEFSMIKIIEVIYLNC